MIAKMHRRRHADGGDMDDDVSVDLPWYRPSILVALAAILVGAFAGGLLVAGLPPADSSPEAGFARDMGVHHSQAVEMAEIARDRTSDPEVRSLAVDIALGQQAQIGQMQGWLAVWGLPATGAEPPMAWMGHQMARDALMPGMATVDDLALLQDVTSDKLDTLFLQLMIAHHRGGVQMAEGVLARTRQPEVRQLAQAIVNGQTAEIAAMSDLLRRKGAAVPSEASGGMDMVTMGHSTATGLVRVNPSVFRDLVFYAPLAMAAFAAAWLVTDELRRRQARLDGLAAGHGRSEGIHSLAVGGLALGSALHLGLWPTYGLGQPGTTLLFMPVALGMAALGGVILACPSDRTLAVGAALALLATSVFFVLRLVPVLTGETTLALDGVELIALTADFTALVSCALLWLSKPVRASDMSVDSPTGAR